MASNTYTGLTTISGASESTLNTYSLGTSSGLTFSDAGGTVAFGSNSTSAAALTLSAHSVLTPNTYDIGLSGNIGGLSGDLFILGPGKITLTGTLAASALSSIHIQGSTLNVTSASLGTGLGSPPPINIDTLGGTLQAGGDLTIPSGQSITLAGVPGTIDLNGHTVSIASVITGAGNLIVTGTGTLTLTNGSNSYEGSTSIFNGTVNAVAGAFPNDAITSPAPGQLIFGGLGAPVGATPKFQLGGSFATFTPAIVFMSNAIIDTNGYTMSASGVVAGVLANSFTLAGTGTLTLAGANIYKGPTIVSAGTLQAGIAFTGSSGAFGYNSAVTVATGATLDLNNFNNTVGSLTGSGSVLLGTGTITVNNGNSLTFAGNITGSSGGLSLTQGTFTLSGSNAYSGATTVTAGTLLSGSSVALANNSTFVIGTQATLNLNGNSNTIKSLSGSSGGAVILGNQTLTLSNGSSSTFAGSITGSGGALTLTTGTQILSGSNSYTGATTINGGTLQAGAINTLSSGSAVSIASGGSLSLNGFNNTIKSLTGPSGSSVNLGSGVLAIANGNTQTFTGAISGVGGGLTLSSGQLTLAGTNTYTGPTIVNTGTLIASTGNTSPFGVGSNITVENGGTLNFGTINASGVTVGTLQNSASVIGNMTLGKLNVAGYTQISNGALSLTIPGTGVSGFEAMSSTGAITLAGALTVTGLSTATAPVILIQGTGAPNQLSGVFSSSTLPAGFSLQYDYAENQVYLTGGSSGGCNGTWNHNSTANWGDIVNWNPATCAPGVSNTPGDLDTATFANLGESRSISVYLATSGTSGPAVQNVTLYDISFNADTTEYNILSYFGSTITLDGVVSPKPRITVSAGSHALYPPIILNKDSRFSLAGALTMGLFSSITGSGSTLFVSEDDTAGVFNNLGAIAPGNVTIQGCTINNYSTISPTSALTIQALAGNASSLVVNNYNSMLPASLVIDGSASATIINNIGSGEVLSPIGQISTTGGITITNATVSNTLGGQIFAASGQTLTINSGTVSNDAASIIGSTGSNLSLVGGMLSSSGKVLADNYTQASGSTLQINVLDVVNSGNLAISGTGNLGGTLAVNALPGFTLSSTQVIPLVTDANGFASHFSNYELQNFPSSVIPEIVVTSTSIDLATTPVTISHISAGSQMLFNAITMHNSFITRKCSQLKNRMPKTSKKETVDIRKTMQGDVVYQEQPPMFQLADRLAYSQDGQEFEIASSNQWEYQEAAWHILPHWSLPKNKQAVTLTESQKQAQLSRKIQEESQRTFNVYAGPTSSFGSSKSLGSQVGLGYSTVGALAGFDAILGTPSEGYVSGGIGSIVSYEKLWGSAHHDAGSMDLDKVHGSIYGTILPSKLPELYFEMIAGCAYSWDGLKREAGFDGSLQAKSHTNELIFDGLAGVEYTVTNKAAPFFGKSFSMTPLLHLQYAHDHVYGFKEKGAGIYNLKVDSQNVQALTSSLGARFDYFFSYSKFNMMIELDAEWQREYLNRNRSVYFTPFNITDISSATSISATARNSGLVALDIFTNFSKGWQLEANGTFQWNHLAYNAFFYLGFGRAF
ncbi:MAG: autotransporter domain-containing protein [Chlamydiae bacterium]|nr:autotransporter domain-containing protein [Chlamydiota bacterium]